MKKGDGSVAQRSAGAEEPIKHVFKTILSREPTAKELRLLKELHAARLAHYQKTPTAATKMLAVGASPAEDKLAPPRVAALADVCHTILNLSEAITRK